MKGHDLIYTVFLGKRGELFSISFNSFFHETLDFCFLLIPRTGHVNLFLIISVNGCQASWQHERGLMVWEKQNGGKRKLS